MKIATADRPFRYLFAALAGGLILTSAAVLWRGVRGRWPWSRAARARDPEWPVDKGWGENEGEGNRTASRHYDQEVREFIDEGRVAPAARSAAIAVEGTEGPSLRAAEAKGRTSPTNGH